MWKREDLEKATQPNRDALARMNDKVHRAALAYARYHDLTDEQTIDRNSVKAELDSLVDELHNDDIWNARELQGIEVMRGLTIYKRERDALKQDDRPFRNKSQGRDSNGR